VWQRLEFFYAGNSDWSIAVQGAEVPVDRFILESSGCCVTLILACCVDKGVSNFSYNYSLVMFLTCEIWMLFCCALESDEDIHDTAKQLFIDIECDLVVRCFSCRQISLFNLPELCCIYLIFYSCEPWNKLRLWTSRNGDTRCFIARWVCHLQPRLLWEVFLCPRGNRDWISLHLLSLSSWASGGGRGGRGKSSLWILGIFY